MNLNLNLKGLRRFLRRWLRRFRNLLSSAP